MGRNSTEYRSCLDFLFERLNYERSTQLPYTKQHYRLNRMRHLLERLGSPHLASPVIHIAGTKGKGSVAWLLSEALRRSGFRTGLYTSPHLIHLEERFVFQGEACKPEQLIEMVRQLQPVAEELSGEHGVPTFFELTTALAWMLFRENKADVSVIEVGLGGRLDSTNVCMPELTIITSISLDHQQQLGETLGRIAGEKAGIIKPGIPVVSGATAPEAAGVIEHVAYQSGSTLWQLDSDFKSTWSPPELQTLTETTIPQGKVSFHWSDSAKVHFPKGCPDRVDWTLGLLGEHQSRNAALALASVDVLRSRGWEIEEAAVQESLSQTKIIARTQIVSKQPWIVVDSAHNIASVAALTETLQTHFHPRRRILIFSASKDKDYEKMIQALLECFDSIILTQFQSNPRAVPLDHLAEIAREMAGNVKGSRPMLYEAATPESALSMATELASEEDLICIAGSFFLAAEVLPLCQSKKGALDAI